MLKLLSNLLNAWRSDPSPQWSARSPRQRVEVAYLWLLQSRAQAPGSHLADLHLLPGENAGQKKLPALIVHCQTAEEIGPGASASADLFHCDLQIHLEADFKAKRGAASIDQQRAALIIGEVSAMLADDALCKTLLNDATLAERPFSHFHLLRHLERQSMGVPLGGSIYQDTINLELWMHTFDFPTADPVIWEEGNRAAWADGTEVVW